VASTEDRKRQLEGRLAELTDSLERLEEDRDEMTESELVGEVDEPDDDRTEELDEMRRGEMRRIRAALDRIDDGTYGTCTNCGQRIAEERLDALPATPFCSGCAAIVEDEP
jgi:RNA polymerase-binding transcription factor DksA